MAKLSITISDVDGTIEIKNNFAHLETRDLYTPAEKVMYNLWLISWPYLQAILKEQALPIGKETHVRADAKTLHLEMPSKIC